MVIKMSLVGFMAKTLGFCTFSCANVEIYDIAHGITNFFFVFELQKKNENLRYWLSRTGEIFEITRDSSMLVTHRIRKNIKYYIFAILLYFNKYTLFSGKNIR